VRLHYVIGGDGPTSVVEQLLVLEENTVVLRLRWTGTHTGSYLGVAPTGRRVDVGVTIWRFEEGRVVEDWTVGHIALEIFGVQLPPPVPTQPDTGGTQ
jgi:SnoaL-like polyketide cyclase